MKWYTINSVNDVESIIDRSRVVPCLILKHSTRCPISSMAKNRVEMSWDFEDDQLEAYYLDLIAFRDISNHIADEFGVPHESPQALLIKDGKCVYNASHLNIRVSDLKAQG
ncbi:bacillithiol system redox-active protein YtxJ [Neolewinella aurantiaca]|uniref:Bacillithiol system redox-active protein YtxJ n=1 Tax=Neolewinella aurantiaca TaxID=2602767 RepID=A0A5C7FJQ7_9BACT|nr:bacillithiol system redox-active protein YtxJ [Neolewinella aurantiaca]TXF91535.1 bacillithiol system redox-active protein YtxJ [Neolewinella aurantiaca]